MVAITRRISRLPPPAGVPVNWGEIHPVLQRVYAQRNIRSAQEIEHGLDRLIPPARLKNADRAAELLHGMMSVGGRILIIADFDADGATSCALAIKALRAMGAVEVGYLVPNRFEYGYGLTPEIVAEALKRQPDLLMTVDNGISSLDGVAAAKAAGVKVLITDHHLPGQTLPAADVIVNPNCRDDGFPSKALAGVGVTFYVMAALRARLRECGWFEQKAMAVPNLGEYLDLVALGTVADVVPLDQNNRILVQNGLRRIRSRRGSPGIQALLSIANRSVQRCIASDLGFAAGPRLNAAGRLDDMSLGIECLLAEDAHQAMDLARTLDQLNRQRREIEAEMQEQALEGLLEAMPEGDLPHGLCLYQADWHQGVIGILASRIKERFYRPVIAFAQAEEKGMLKGSARSVSGVHIRDVLEAIAAERPGMLQKFGGHAMAAGLSLREEDYMDFSLAFDRQVQKRLGSEAIEGVIISDGALAHDQMSLDLAEAIREAGPWGQAFPEPCFDGVFQLIDQRIVGEKHLKMVLRPREGSIELDAIAFNQAGYMLDKTGGDIEVAYRLDVNEFRGSRQVQLMVEYFAAVE